MDHGRVFPGPILTKPIDKINIGNAEKMARISSCRSKGYPF
jgi:hypothetical protein